MIYCIYNYSIACLYSLLYIITYYTSLHIVIYIIMYYYILLHFIIYHYVLYILYIITRDKIIGTASQFEVQKCPSCYTNLKCRAINCDTFLLELLIYINLLFMSQYCYITQLAFYAPPQLICYKNF